MHSPADSKEDEHKNIMYVLITDMDQPTSTTLRAVIHLKRYSEADENWLRVPLSKNK